MRALAHRHRVRNVAVKHLDVLLEPFEQPHARIVARDDALRAGDLHEQRR